MRNLAQSQSLARSHVLKAALALLLTCSVLVPLGASAPSAWANVDKTGTAIKPGELVPRNSVLIESPSQPGVSSTASRNKYHVDITGTSPQGIDRSETSGYASGRGIRYKLNADWDTRTAAYEPVSLNADVASVVSKYPYNLDGYGNIINMLYLNTLPGNPEVRIAELRKYMTYNVAAGLYSNRGFTFEIGKGKRWTEGEAFSATFTYPLVGSYNGSDVGATLTIAGNYKKFATERETTQLEGLVTIPAGTAETDFDYPVIQLPDSLFCGGYVWQTSNARFTLEFFDVATKQKVNLGNSYLTFCSQNVDGTLSDGQVHTAADTSESVWLPDSATKKVEYVQGTNMANKNLQLGGTNFIVSYPTSQRNFNEGATYNHDRLGMANYLLNATTFYQDGSFRFESHRGDFDGAAGRGIGNRSNTGWFSFMSAALGVPDPKNPVKGANKAEVKVGDAVEYTIDQAIPTLGSETLAGYSSMRFSDVLDSSLEYVSARMYYVDPAGKKTDVTSAAGTGSWNANTRTVEYNFKSAYLEINGDSAPTKRMPYEGGKFQMVIGVKVISDSKQVIDNKGTVTINGKGKDTNIVRLKLANLARLTIAKTVDFEHAVGDKASYSIVLENPKKNSIAENVRLSDATLPTGIAIDASSVKVQGVPTTVEVARVASSSTGDTIVVETKPNTPSVSTANNKLSVTIPYLPAGNKVTVSFTANCPASHNGREVFNTATATFDNPLAGTPGTVTASDGMWINSAELEILKRADKFEYRVGDIATYTVTLNNKIAGTIARNVVLTDSDLPDRVKVDPASIKVSGIPSAVKYNIDGNGTHKDENRANKHTITPKGNGFVLTIPYLPSSTPVTITYTATCTKDSNGLETMNSATAALDNPTSPETKNVTSVDGIWVNNVEMTIAKRADKFEYAVGDTITYTVMFENKTTGTVAENVLVSDMSLPKTLALDASSIQVNGMPQRVDFPVDGNGTHKTEPREVSWKVTPQGNGFSLSVNYLPAHTPVTITYQAKALEASNGKLIPNTATVQAGNPLPGKEKASATDTIWVNSVKLDVLKRADAFEYRVGDTATYTINVLNNAPAGTIARNVVVRDTDLPKVVSINPKSIRVDGVPASVNYPVDGGAEPKTQKKDAGSKVEVQGNGFVVTIPYLPAGTLATITYTATCTEAANGLETMNSATASADNPMDPKGQPVISRDGIWTNDAVLSLTKEVDEYETQVDDTVHYTVTLQNIASGTIAHNATISDVTLPHGLRLVADSVKVQGVPDQVDYPIDGNGTHKTEPREAGSRIEQADNGFTVHMPLLPAGHKVVLTYDAIPTEEVNGDEIVNTAVARADNVLGDEELQASALIWVNTPHLAVDKQVIEPQTAYAQGDVVTYRIQVTNEQAGTFARNIVIDDVFQTDGMQLVRASMMMFDEAGDVFDGYVVKQNMFNANWTLTTGRNLVCTTDTYSIWEHAAATKTDQLNPLGEEVESVLWVEFQAVVTAESLTGQEVINMAGAVADNAERVEDSATINIPDPREPANIIAEKSSEPHDGEAVAPGQTIDYTITLTNIGQMDAIGVAVFDAVPQHTTLTTVPDEHHATIAQDGSGVGWLIDTIEPGQTQSVHFSVVVSKDVERGSLIVNGATFDMDVDEVPAQPLPTSTNEVKHPVMESELMVHKYLMSLKDNQATYRIQVTNNGNKPTENGLVLEDTFENLNYLEHYENGGDAEYQNNTFILGSIEPGRTLGITATFAVVDPLLGITNRVWPREPEDKRYEIDKVRIAAEDDDTVVSGDVEPGSTLYYLVRVKNTATKPLEDCTVYDIPQTHLNIERVSTEQGTVAINDDGVAVWAVSELEPDETATMLVVARVNEDAQGHVTNCATSGTHTVVVTDPVPPVEPEPEPEPKPDPKPVPEPEPAPDPKDDPKDDPKPEPEPEPKPEPEPAPEPEPEPKNDPEPEPKPLPTPIAEPDPKDEPKDEPEPKDDPKDEPASEPEPKDEPKDEPKPKDEPSSDSKETPKQTPSTSTATKPTPQSTSTTRTQSTGSTAQGSTPVQTSTTSASKAQSAKTADVDSKTPFVVVGIAAVVVAIGASLFMRHRKKAWTAYVLRR